MASHYQSFTGKKNNIVFLIIIGVIFILAFANAPSIIPWFIVLLSVVFYFSNLTYLISLFLILLPLKGIVQPNFLLPGHIQTIYIPAFLVMVKLINIKSKNLVVNYNMVFIIKLLSLFILFYFIYVNFKNVYFNLDFHIGWGQDKVELSYTKAVRRSVKYIFYFLPIIFISRKITGENLI